MSQKNLTVGIVGSGGDGMMLSGEMLVSSAAAEGLYAFMLKSFGPQIRGGESSCRVRISTERIRTQGDAMDVLAIFGWKNYSQFEEELDVKDGITIFYDTDDATPENELPIDPKIQRTVYRIPFNQIAKEATGATTAKNLVLLGVLGEFYNLPVDCIEKTIRARFKKRGPEMVETSIKAFEAGRAYGKNHPAKSPENMLSYTKGAPKIMIDGNDAVSYGAIFAGCDFFAGYPITPSSEIMEFMLKELPKFDRPAIQVEDEISAVNMLMGASFAGRKPMTATSGPGVSLMTEGIGLGVIAELPCVIVNVQRGGPSTGIPTKMEQSDLLQGVFATHGDAPKVVVAPIDVEDCFDLTVAAFNIAEKYQTPVIILSDQFVGQRIECIDPFDLSKFTIEKRLVPTPEELEQKKYCRFEITENGVSKMTRPGMKNGQYLACGLTHNEKGGPSAQHKVHEKMHAKRFAKFPKIQEEYGHLVRRFGRDDANIGVLAWGSSAGAVEEAVAKANSQGHKVSAMLPQLLYPLPVKALQDYVNSIEKLLVVELSYWAQFYLYLRTGIDLPKECAIYKRSGGMPLTVDEIYQHILKVIG